jgi:hypothetical protein
MIKWKAQKVSYLINDETVYIVNFDLEYYNIDKVMVESQKEILFDYVKLNKFINDLSPLDEYWDLL